MSRIKFVASSRNKETEGGPEGGVALRGTRAFMAPERLTRGSTGLTTDVYAYAMTCYQVSTLSLKPDAGSQARSKVYTKEPPFHGVPEEHIWHVVTKQHKRPDRPKIHVQPQMWEVITACWETERERRPKFDKIVDQLRFIT